MTILAKRYSAAQELARTRRVALSTAAVVRVESATEASGTPARGGSGSASTAGSAGAASMSPSASTNGRSVAGREEGPPEYGA
ncbi:hypothetical protein CALCODRAFT_488701 [Calocera cornea HHB12733]|uniref:Uncharacterized protein n=1 Tax=Calocera cornea HHB12733 TaxID=1353952 RepID=A0A165C9G2_9BASI|nr:hypothetical protein CALCODRAFT_488701 [Calocera cornea HHB12733]